MHAASAGALHSVTREYAGLFGDCRPSSATNSVSDEEMCTGQHENSEDDEEKAVRQTERSNGGAFLRGLARFVVDFVSQ